MEVRMQLDEIEKGILGDPKNMFPINKLDALIDGIIDQQDNSEDVVKTYYCFINRKKGRGERKREGGKEGEREGGSEGGEREEKERKERRKKI